MSIETTITCDALDCIRQIDCCGTDSPAEILKFNNWHFDPTTEEFQYCDKCWPAVEAEYQEMFAKKEIACV